MCLYMWNVDISDVNLKAVAEFSQIYQSYHVLSYPLYIEQKWVISLCYAHERSVL